MMARLGQPLLSGVALALTLAAGASAQSTPGASERIAIVIGNEAYAAAPDLANAVRDATDMAAMLRDYGFAVHDGYNLTRREFEELLRAAMLNVPEGGDVVFFYAGHGIQIGRRNYLLPVDVEFDSIYDLPTYSMTLDRVIEALSSRGATHLAIIDACRENPFPNLRLAADLDANLFETQTGFEVFRTPLNSLIAFSTSPGEVALDGAEGGNSPYTAAVLETARNAPDESVLVLFSQVRERVYQATAGRQVPWESSTLVRPFRLMDEPTPSSLQLAQNQAVDQGARTTSTPPPPVSTEIALPLDRRVDLTGRIERAAGAPLMNAAIVAAPGSGQVTVDATGAGLSYRPTLAEVRATELSSFTHSDSFRIETGPFDARQTVTVDLSLDATDCDIQAGDALDLQGVGLYRLPNEIEIDSALAACTAAVEAAPDTPRFRYQLGRAQQANGEFVEAFESFQAAAEAGHIRALNAEAYLLFTDRINRDLVPIPRDEARAIELMERGIAEGDAFAIHSRGLRLLRHGETAEDRNRGWELLSRSAELGHTYSMNELGVYFLDPEGEHYQPERGLNFLNASSARDDIYGHHNLGFVALFGLDGNEPDYARARDWFERAALGGHPHSPSSIGRMLMRGQLGEPDYPEAVRWFDEGLARGDGWGGANAANIILAAPFRA
jgi:TPR repeat protein